MDDNEIILRAIGVLTESQRMFAALREDPDADYELSGALTEFVNETIPPIALPADASLEQAAAAGASAVVEASARLMQAFTYLFWELTEVHDAGRTDITSEDVLRTIALDRSSPRAES